MPPSITPVAGFVLSSGDISELSLSGALFSSEVSLLSGVEFSPELSVSEAVLSLSELPLSSEVLLSSDVLLLLSSEVSPPLF